MNYYDESIEFAPLYKAMKRCCRNLRWKDSVIGYEANALRNTFRLRQDLINGKYSISKYQSFIIHEPKERAITATRLRDRQFQMAMCLGGLYKDFTEHYISDNPACQTNRGTDYALNRMTEHLRRHYRKHGNEGYVLKCDIKHFFPNTNHNVAKKMVKKYVEDESACQRVFDIIDSFGDEKGMGLGSQISQLVELCVLTDLDHYIKEQLHIQHYIRYMDDMVLIHESKAYLVQCRIVIAERLAELGFELHPKKTQIFKLSQGVIFMNWRFRLTPSGRILRLMPKAKLSKQRRRLRRLWEKEVNGEVESGTTRTSLQSWLANAKRGDTFYQRKRMIKYFKELTNGKYHS